MTHRPPSGTGDVPARGRRGPSGRWLRIAGAVILSTSFASAVFVAALAATMPATILARFVDLPPQVEALSGRVLEGRARLQGGLLLDWSAWPAGVLRGALPVDIVLRGPATLLEGQARFSPNRVAVTDLRGRAGPDLLALVPGGPDCAVRALVAVDRLVLSRDAGEAGGTVQTEAGTCDGGAVPVPALLATLGTEDGAATARVAAVADAGVPLGALRADGWRRVALQVEPAGAALIPGLPTGGPTILEYAF